MWLEGRRMVIFRGFEVGGGGYIGKMLYLCRLLERKELRVGLLLERKGLMVNRKCSCRKK